MSELGNAIRRALNMSKKACNLNSSVVFEIMLIKLEFFIESKICPSH